MIALSTITYDIAGHIVIKADPQSIYPNLERRVSRVATLDGESTIADLGFTYSDMTYSIKTSNMTTEQITKLENIIKTYSLIRISTREGAFTGVISKMSVGIRPVEFTLLIKRKISE